MSNTVKLVLSRVCGMLALFFALFLSNKEPTILVSAAVLAYIAMDWRLDIIESKLDEEGEEEGE